jgi:hypothetical protein
MFTVYFFNKLGFEGLVDLFESALLPASPGRSWHAILLGREPELRARQRRFLFQSP